MRSRQESQKAGVSTLSAFLAVGVVAVVAILAVMIAALSGPEGASPGIAPGIGTNVTNATDVTPTPGPHRLRIVVGAGVDPTPEPTKSPDTGMIVDQETDKTARHIAFAFQPNVTGIADFTAYWTIPRGPLYDGGPKHTIFLWTGIQQGNSGLIQAVLEWDHDHTGKYWTLACWIVNAKDQSYRASPRIDAYPGDLVKAEIRYETDLAHTGRKVWHVILTDVTRECSTELIDGGRAVDTNRDIMVFSGVLEGIGPVTDGDDLPGDMMFRDIVYKDENGKDLPVYLTGYVNPMFGHVAVEYEDGQTGSPVIIRTNYSI